MEVRELLADKKMRLAYLVADASSVSPDKPLLCQVTVEGMVHNCHVNELNFARITYLEGQIRVLTQILTFIKLVRIVNKR